MPERGCTNCSQIASGSYARTVIIWDVATGDKVSEQKGHSNWVKVLNGALGSPT